MHYVVLSGGGANGAYQAGALRALVENGWNPEGVVGTSVGALNGAKFCEVPLDSPYAAASGVVAEWDRIGCNRDIYKPWLWGKIPSALLFSLKIRPSIYSTKPLQVHVRKTLDVEAMRTSKRKFLCNAISVGSEWKTRWFDENDPHIVSGILASSSFPVYFEPIRIDGQDYSDGGLRDMTPISGAIKSGATHIDIISCSRGEMPQGKNPKGLDQVGGMLSTLSHEIDTSDFEMANVINELVKMESPLAVERGWRVVSIRILRPSRSPGNSLDFSRKKNQRLMDMGYSDALKLNWAL